MVVGNKVRSKRTLMLAMALAAVAVFVSAAFVISDEADLSADTAYEAGYCTR